jgi:hypothetical protein
MATSETVTLNEAHAPLQASIDAFNTILPSLKDELTKLRRDHDSTSPLHLLTPSLCHSNPPDPPPEHEPEYFARVSSLSDSDLTSFTSSDLASVRVANSAYGLHLFGKVRLPAVKDAYIHVRIFGSAKEGTDGSEADEREYKLHSVHTEETVKSDGDRVYRAVFAEKDELEWFDT